MARRETILTFEEIKYLSEIFVSLGIEKIRLTGGEPMMRRGILDIVSMLAELKPDLRDLALTTNGLNFPANAGALRKASLDRVTISLDTLDRQKFIDITGVDELENVLASIEAARSVGFSKVKVNACVVRGRNDDELVAMARFARDNGISFRFIEFMPLDSRHEWDRNQVVSGREIHDAINAVFPLVLAETSRGSGTAWNYRFADGSPGEIGIIAPVTEMFCGQCSRIRLTADGQIRTCLFSTTEHNLRDVLRSGASLDEIIEFIEAVVLKKEPRHYINDTAFVTPSRSMSFIGG